LETALNDQAAVVEAGQELKKIHEDHLTEVTEKRKALKTAQQAAKARTAEVVALKKELVETKKKIDAFDERQAGTVAALAQEQQELDAARARIDTLESKLREAMQRMSPLQKELDESTTALSALQATHKKVATSEAAIKKELRDVEKQITKINYSLEEERTLRTEAERARDEALALSNTQDLQQQLLQHQERIGALETTEHASADTIVALKKKLAETEHQFKQEQQRLSELRDRAKATLGVDQQKDARIQYLEGKLEAFQHEKHGQLDMHHNLHEQIISLEEQLKSAQKVNAVLKSQHVDEKPVEPRVNINLKVVENNNRLGNLLLKSGVITQAQLDEVLLERQHPGYSRSYRIGKQLVDKGYANEDVIAQAIAHQMNIPFLRIERNTVKYSAVRFVSKQMATKHQCIPAFVQAGNLMLAMVNPMDLVAIEDIERCTSLPVKIMVSTADDVQDAIKRYYR
jgi:predicted  nucleic acid-binding Zn-ribbon protein